MGIECIGWWSGRPDEWASVEKKKQQYGWERGRIMVYCDRVKKTVK